MENQYESVEPGVPQTAVDEVPTVGANAPEAELRCSGSLVLLRWIERFALKADHAKLRKSQADDQWWVISGEDTTGPHEFCEVINALSDGISPLQVVAHSQLEDESPPWVTLQYRPHWRDPKVALAWRAGVWIVGILFVYVAISGVTPWALHKWVNTIFLFALIALLAIRWIMTRKVRHAAPVEPSAQVESADPLDPPERASS